MTRKQNRPKSARLSGDGEIPARRRSRPHGFLWGLTLGFLATLAVVIGVDGGSGWNFLPGIPALPSQATTASAPVQASKASSVFLATQLPAGSQVFVDGRAVDVTPGETGVVVPVQAQSRKLEIRGAGGPWWSTRLSASAPDTLRPLLGGELVVQVDRQGPVGALFVDGVLRGTAPGAVGDVLPGWHRFSVRDGDRVLYEDACDVRPGEVTVVTVPPVPPRGKGRILVRSRVLENGGFRTEDGLAVWVDGWKAGTTPIEVPLKAGFHSVRVERPSFGSSVEVLYLEAGRTRYVNADFGEQEPLSVSVLPPSRIDRNSPVAIPVRVESDGESVLLESGTLDLVRATQSKPIQVPLVSSRTDSRLWVAVVPPGLLGNAKEVSGFASCVDERGRRGHSEIFRLAIP